MRVWDVRQRDAPVAAFEPADSNNIRWALLLAAPAAVPIYSAVVGIHMTGQNELPGDMII